VWRCEFDVECLLLMQVDDEECEKG